MSQIWYADAARHRTAPPLPGAARDFHASLPGYAPTPLVEAPELAAELGVAAVWVKDESARLGIAAFKILGASWAGARLVAERTDARSRGWPGCSGCRPPAACPRSPSRPPERASPATGGGG